MRNFYRIIVTFLIFISFSFVKINKKQFVVLIDASHGGNDFGSSYKEFAEKAIVASISKKVAALNSDSEIIIRFTRTDDESLTLLERVKIVNEIKPDLLISLHINSSKNSINSGYEVYVSKENKTFEKSNEIANSLIKSFNKNYPLQNKGLKTASFFILKKSEVPSILIELGYLSNDFDRNYITNEQSQNEIAKIILDFLAGLK